MSVKINDASFADMICKRMNDLQKKERVVIKIPSHLINIDYVESDLPFLLRHKIPKNVYLTIRTDVPGENIKGGLVDMYRFE